MMKFDLKVVCRGIAGLLVLVSFNGCAQLNSAESIGYCAVQAGKTLKLIPADSIIFPVILLRVKRNGVLLVIKIGVVDSGLAYCGMSMRARTEKNLKPGQTNFRGSSRRFL